MSEQARIGQSHLAKQDLSTLVTCAVAFSFAKIAASHVLIVTCGCRARSSARTVVAPLSIQVILERVDCTSWR